jgi:hypothetical protein
MEYRTGLLQSRDYHHIMHFLDTIHRDIVCNADDILLVSGEMGTGTVQFRQCRSWDKLQTWSKQYNACFRFISDNSLPEIDRYVFCPEGSQY